jgi:hypothetical protein
LTVSKFVTPQRKMAPVKGAIRLVASLRSLAVMMMVVMVVGWAMRLCAWNREGDSGDGGQSESKFSHKNHS